MANPESAPKIDWAYYKKTVVTPGLVDKFQKEYEAISIPYPADKYTAEIDVQKQDMVISVPFSFMSYFVAHNCTKTFSICYRLKR